MSLLQKKVFTLFVALLLLTIGISACTEYQERGGLAGGAIGGIAGAILDSRNPWRGGVIGAGLGAIAGATIADISARGSRQVYETGRPVEYKTESGAGVYRAEPEGEPYYADSNTQCRKVREKEWENGQLVRDHVKEVCESAGYERRY